MPATFTYRCACGHSRRVDTDDADTPQARTQHLLRGGWRFEGLTELCPCCVAHRSGQHDHQAREVDDGAQVQADADLNGAALAYERLLRRARLRATGDDWRDEAVRLHSQKIAVLEQQQAGLAQRAEAAQIRERLRRKCRICHRDPNEVLIVPPTTGFDSLGTQRA